MSTETLAPDVGWEASGHLSEVALSAVADGEEALLDAAMHAHLGACDACALQLGEVALRSAEVAEAFTHVAAHVSDLAALAAPAPAVTAPLAKPRAKRKIPGFAIAAALAVALLGMMPSLPSVAGDTAQALVVLRKVAPSFLRLLPQALERAWNGPRGTMMFLVWGLAAGLVTAGFGIAKRASKRALVDGERQ